MGSKGKWTNQHLENISKLFCSGDSENRWHKKEKKHWGKCHCMSGVSHFTFVWSVFDVIGGHCPGFHFGFSVVPIPSLWFCQSTALMLFGKKECWPQLWPPEIVRHLIDVCSQHQTIHTCMHRQFALRELNQSNKTSSGVDPFHFCASISRTDNVLAGRKGGRWSTHHFDIFGLTPGSSNEHLAAIVRSPGNRPKQYATAGFWGPLDAPLFVSFLVWEEGCGASSSAGRCRQYRHIALLNKIFPGKSQCRNRSPRCMPDPLMVPSASHLSYKFRADPRELLGASKRKTKEDTYIWPQIPSHIVVLNGGGVLGGGDKSERGADTWCDMSGRGAHQLACGWNEPVKQDQGMTQKRVRISTAILCSHARNRKQAISWPLVALAYHLVCQSNERTFPMTTLCCPQSGKLEKKKSFVFLFVRCFSSWK